MLPFQAQSHTCEERLLALSRPSVRMYRRCFHRTDCNEVWCLGLRWKYAEKFQIWSGAKFRGGGGLTWRSKHVLLLRMTINSPQKHFHATLCTFMLLTVTWISTVQRESSFAFPLQQWLRERAKLLRCTYIAHIFFPRACYIPHPSHHTDSPIVILLGKKKNSVALVRERTIPTERPPPVGEVSANFCG